MFAASIEDKNQPRTQRPAGDEEVAAVPHKPRGPQPERDDADRVDDEKDEVNVHAGRLELDAVDRAAGQIVQADGHRASPRVDAEVAEELEPALGGRFGFKSRGTPVNITSGPNVASSGPGANVPACSGPATNSQNGSKSVKRARAGS